MAMFCASSLLGSCYSPPFPTRLCTQRLQRGLASPPFARCSGPATPASLVSAGGGCAPVQAMTVERDLHMATGDGEHSYAVNSIFQVRSYFIYFTVNAQQ